MHAPFLKKLTDREIRSGAKAIPPLGAYSWWQHKRSTLLGMLQIEQKFRKQTRKECELYLLPDEGGLDYTLWRIANDKQRNDVPVELSLNHRLEDSLVFADRIQSWANANFMQSVQELADALELDIETCAKKFARITLPEEPDGWRSSPLVGFSKYKREALL